MWNDDTIFLFAKDCSVSKYLQNARRSPELGRDAARAKTEEREETVPGYADEPEDVAQASADEAEGILP